MNAEVQTLLTGLGLGECPRWHEGRLWFANWGMQEIVTVDLDGNSEIIVRVPTTIPFSIDWLTDGRLLVVSGRERLVLRRESHGKRLTAFDIAADGSLSNRRVWADLGEGVPDGICVDAENAVWYGDVPNQRCVRVREGGEVLQTINLDRGCFACMLGGPENRTLFMMAAEWHGFAKMMDGLGTGRVFTVEVSAPGVGWP